MIAMGRRERFLLLLVLAGVFFGTTTTRLHTVTKDPIFSSSSIDQNTLDEPKNVVDKATGSSGGKDAVGSIPKSLNKVPVERPVIKKIFERSQLYIEVESWNEGLSSWRNSVARMMSLARKLNATLVEPWVRDGRLMNGAKGKIPLSAVFEASRYTQFHPKWVSWEDYQSHIQHFNTSIDEQAASSPVLSLEACWKRKKSNKTCKNGMKTEDGKRFSPRLRAALDAVESNKYSMVVLRLHEVWKTSLDGFHMGPASKVPLIEEAEANRAYQYLRFRTSLYELVRSSLERQGIPRNSQFAVLHWRAERENIDYVRCANRILLVQEVIGSVAAASTPNVSTIAEDTTKTNLPWVLMSSLSTNQSRMWAGAKTLAESSGGGSMQALTMLQEAGWAQIEDLGLDDLVLYAALDLILAELADVFTSCVRTCVSTFGFCKACNHVGNFAHLAVTLRNKKPHTYPCWPNNASQLAHIQDFA